LGQRVAKIHAFLAEALTLGLLAAQPNAALALSTLQAEQPLPVETPLQPPAPIIKRAPLPPLAVPGANPGEQTPPGIGPVPLPAPIEGPSPSDEPSVTEPTITGPVDGSPIDLPVERDLSTLPVAVQALHSLLIEAARTGDVEKLRPLLGSGGMPTQLSFGEIDTDPIDYLKASSGDEAGAEILAILIDILDTGFVTMNAASDADVEGENADQSASNDAIYVWPYFVARPLETLTPPEKVELFRLVTAGDYEDMKAFGAYNFYRLGITPDGRWAFFVSGD
jgi:hypothetical protein